MPPLCKHCGHESAIHFLLNNECSFPECSCPGLTYRSLGSTGTAGEVRTFSSTGAAKGMKPERFDLVPIEPLRQLARLYANGAVKYEAHNWRKGYEWSKSYAAAMRHMTSFWDGEDIDPEMGIPHVICAVFHMFGLAEYITKPEQYSQFDDRYVYSGEVAKALLIDGYYDEVATSEESNGHPIDSIEDATDLLDVIWKEFPSSKMYPDFRYAQNLAESGNFSDLEVEVKQAFNTALAVLNIRKGE